VRFVDQLAKKNLLHTWQRPNIPQYSAIERILGEEVHDALSGAKSDRTALADAADRINRELKSSKK
jgi:multiple sugar transport system substrate-binding protein